MPLFRTPTGKIVSLSQEEAGSAAANGYEPVAVGSAGLGTEEAPDTGGVGGLLAGVTGGLSGATLGLSDVIGSQFASPGQRGFVQQSREQHPITTGSAQLIGAMVPSLVAPGSGLAATPAGAAASLGRTIIESAAPAGTGIIGRTAAHALGAGAEGALFSGGDYLSQMALEDKPLSAEGFVGAMGHGAMFGAPIGVGLSLGGEALQRASSLFPRRQMSAAAATGIAQEATSTLKQAVADGDQMVEAARRRIGITDSKIGLAERGEQATRDLFGDAHPQAITDQALGGVEAAQLKDALGKYEASKAQLADWVRTAGDPDLEAALSGLQAPEVQSIQMRRSGVQWPPEPSEIGAGEAGFGADQPTSAGGKRPQAIAPSVPNDLLASVRQPDSFASSTAADSTRQVRGIGKGTPPQGVPADLLAGAGEPPLSEMNPDQLRHEMARLDNKLGDLEFGSPEYEAASKRYEQVVDLVTQHNNKLAVDPVGPASASYVEPDVAGMAKPLSHAEFDSFKSEFRNASSDDHYAAGMYYSKGGDVEINGALREGRAPHEFDAKAIADLDDALSRPETALQRDVTLYRGLSGDWAKNHFADMQPGSVFEDPGYLSTAHNADSKVRNEDVVFNIHAPAGAHGIPIPSKFSEEREVLLGRNLKLRIDSNELKPQIPTDSRWKSSKGFEVHPDKSVTIESADGSKHTWPPYRELNVTIVGEHAPPPKIEKLTDEQLISGPLDQFSRKQLKQHQDALTREMDKAGRGTPRYEELSKRWDEAVGFFNGKTPSPTTDYRPPAPSVVEPGNLESLLRGTKAKLDEGASLNKLGTEHPAFKQIDIGTPARPAGRGPHNNYEASAMAANERALQDAQPTGLENLLRMQRESADGPRPGGVDDLKRLLSDHFAEPVPPPVEPPIVSGVPKTRIEPGMADEMSALHRENIGKTIVDRDMRSRMKNTVDDDKIAELLGKHDGKNVDVGPDIAKAAKVINDFERHSADLVEILGQDAPASAQANAKKYREAVGKQSESQAAGSNQLASDISTKVMPAAEHATGGKAGSALGKLADMGTALEVLHALSVHTPALSAIPVIGPILGLFLKARAAMKILGRKGGSVAKSADGTVAAKAAEARNRIAAATGNMLETGARGTKRLSAVAAGPAVTLATKLFPGDGDTKSKDLHVLYDARSEELARALQPGAIAHAIGDRIKVSDPLMQDAIASQIERGLKFIEGKRPKQALSPGMIPGDGAPRISKVLLDEWGKYIHAVNDPASVIEDLAKGHLSIEGAETLRVVYPNLFLDAQKVLMDHAAEFKKTMPYPRRVALSIAYRVPMDGSMTQSHMMFLQPPPTPAAMPGPAGPMQPPMPAITGPLQIGKQTALPGEM